MKKPVFEDVPLSRIYFEWLRENRSAGIDDFFNFINRETKNLKISHPTLKRKKYEGTNTLLKSFNNWNVKFNL